MVTIRHSPCKLTRTSVIVEQAIGDNVMNDVLQEYAAIKTIDQNAFIEKKRDDFVERLIQSTSGVFDLFTIYIGDRLGFYKTLSESGSMTAVELASKTSTHGRYVQEWLEQQTVAGILGVENPQSDANTRLFFLPPGHDEVLTEKDSLNYLAPLAQLVIGVTRPLPTLLNAYQTGGGVPLSEYGEDFRDGQAGINRAMFLQELGQDWIPTIPELHTRLGAYPPARVADIGSGAGWSSIGIAQAYPNVYVDGFDLDEPSIELARGNAQEAGVDNQVNFQVRDAGDPSLAGTYDLVTAFECIHDMSNPVDALHTMRRLANENGIVLIADERVGDSFTPTGNDVEWMMYGWSVLHCLPVGMADQPSAATGTVMRSDTLRQYAQEAGFSQVKILPVDNFFFRLYQLIP
jgi:2-polyprenyl-3-methyl-5-hydroxy-6-metoxy-1,4-benzoquinol methylase